MTRHVLTFEPANPDALNLLGSIALHGGHATAAAGILTQAVQAAPQAAAPRINLGHALKATGRLTEAIQSYRAAVRLQPTDPWSRYALGNALLAAGQLDSAEAQLREATRIAPDFPDAHNNLGHTLRQLGRPNEAEAAFRRALDRAPNRAEWHLNLALALGEQKRTDDAIAALDQAVRLAPDHIDALHAYGTMLVRTRRYREAVPPLRRLRTLLPGKPDPFAGLVQALTCLGQFDEAVALGRETVAQAPDLAGARSNLGAALLALTRLDEAEAEFNKALLLDPGHAAARSGRALTRLTAGRLEEAWDDYEARLDAQRMMTAGDAPKLVDPTRLPGEPWTGEPRNGRSLLVYPEQGLGDLIQMVRYATLLARDGPVSWVVPTSLRRLLAGMPAIETVVTPEEVPPEHDLHCSVMSLPRLFRTSAATIPGGIAYLRTDPVLAEEWRGILQTKADPAVRKICLAWQGNPDYPFDGLRSIPPDLLRTLGGISDVMFVSLQVPRPDKTPPLPMIDLTCQLKDFADTAALMKALDLIVTVDTSVAHLAGALGRPVWLLNRFNTDWRWMLQREDSPWYPSMRIFRQSTPGDWHGVLATVRRMIADPSAA